MVLFRKFTDFPRGTLYDILQDAYSFDPRNKEIWDKNWHDSDDFFYDNPSIADTCGLVTCIEEVLSPGIPGIGRNMWRSATTGSGSSIREMAMGICSWRKGSAELKNMRAFKR